MSNITTTKETLDLWKKKDKVRKMFAPNLTADEFDAFVGLGASLGANPFNREIWAVKYGNSPAQIFLGRDFYRRKAQEQPDYNGHQVDAVYSNDEFMMENGTPKHKYGFGDRGNLIGAYAVVFRSDNSPFFTTVSLSEYSTGKSLWNTKPETMIKKVAEAQALRGAYQGLFAGTYDQSEEWEEEKTEHPSNSTPLPEAVRHLTDRYPFDKTLKCPKNDHRPYLNDGTPELDKIEQDIRDGIIEPNYLRYFYTMTNTMMQYLQEFYQDWIDSQVEIDEQMAELR